ncbi:maleylpyruvate isomerase family mycothiol-dependent enzyme [Cryptosporangium japonicum]|uniref:Maleylpyruvate isomerase family mycothiol-dependent enzyme n=1 Tax=Cryptosporangium japonicum TaxID=80872 RepID=A0ABP3EQ35_9ACTN
MDTFAEIADERRALADLLSGLTSEQRAAPSLCESWTVHDVAAHLIMPLEVGMAKFALTALLCRGDFDRANVRLTREQARRPIDEITTVLRAKAGSRFTPPGSGPEAPLTDLLVHGLDIRHPLRLARDVPPERLRTVLGYLTGRAPRGFVPRNLLDRLRFEADDLDWAHGRGATVRGPAEGLLLVITGRAAGLDQLSGDGVPILRERLS